MNRTPLLGECSAEFFGTMLLILFGCGVVAQVVTAGGTPLTTAPGATGDYNSIAWGWGLGVTMGVYVAGRLSGAHLNPAVTVALAAFKGFPARKIAPYVAAQVAGAFVGALVVRFNYSDLIHNVDPDHTKTQGIFSTSPDANVSIFTAFSDQMVGTAILVAVIFALTSAVNNPPLSNLGPLVIGLLVVAIGLGWGANAGYAINPARDFGPRLASWLTGYDNAWHSANGPQLYFWLPIVAPLIGGLIGGGLFVFCIERFLPAAVTNPAEIGVVEPTPLK